MKYKRLMIVVGLLSLLSIFTWVRFGAAHTFKTGDNVTVAASEVVDNSVYMAGMTVDIAGEVNGDVICAGQNVTVSGKVHGDVICAGQNVSIRGVVDGDVRTAGQNVTISAEIGGNVSVAGQSITFESSAKVAGDATVGGSNATFNGPIGRDLAIGSTTATINSEVGRNVSGALTDLTFGNNAHVKGNVDYQSNQEATVGGSAKIDGKLVRTSPPARDGGRRGALFGFTIGWFMYWLAASLLFALVLILLFPRLFQSAAEKTIKKPARTLLTGFLVNIATPMIAISLMITVIGIPMGLFLLILWGLLLMLSGPFFAYYIGRLIMNNNKNALVVMLVGTLVTVFVYFIPIIGFLVALVAMAMGVGMIFAEIKDNTPKPSYKLK